MLSSQASSPSFTSSLFIFYLLQITSLLFSSLFTSYSSSISPSPPPFGSIASSFLGKMAPNVTIEQGLKIIDDAIARKNAIADGLSAAVPFTTAENMLIYDVIFKLCSWKPEPYSEQFYQKYTNCLKERIMEKAIPNLLGKQGAALLTEVTRTWSEFKAFADSIAKLFVYLDRFYILKRGFPPLADTPGHCFCKLVCEKLYGKIQEATVSLIIKAREGKELDQIDRDLLKAVFRFFLDNGGKGTTDYYAKIEQIILAEASAYYSELSMEWWFWRDSYVNYLRKVDWCLVQEEARAEIYPLESTKAKLLQVMKYILLERTAKRWSQKQKDSGVRAEEDKELISKYASLSLDDHGTLHMQPRNLTSEGCS